MAFFSHIDESTTDLSNGAINNINIYIKVIINIITNINKVSTFMSMSTTTSSTINLNIRIHANISMKSLNWVGIFSIARSHHTSLIIIIIIIVNNWKLCGFNSKQIFSSNIKLDLDIRNEVYRHFQLKLPCSSKFFCSPKYIFDCDW